MQGSPALPVRGGEVGPLAYQHLHHVVVTAGRGYVQAGPPSVVRHFEELGGPGEEEAHHANMAGDAGQVEGDVATGLTGRVNLAEAEM